VSGILVAKQYGAQRIFCLKQTTSDSNGSFQQSTVEISLLHLQAKLESVTVELEKAILDLDDMKIRHALIHQHESLTKRERELKEKLQDLHRQVHALESARCPSTPSTVFEDSSELERKLCGIAGEVTKRKRIANDMIGFISEISGTSRRDIIDDLGLEIEFTEVSEKIDISKGITSPYRGC